MPIFHTPKPKNDMRPRMTDWLACLPPAQIVVVGSRAPTVTKGVVDILVRPLRGLREQAIAITGWGLPPGPEVEGITRHTLPPSQNGVTVSYLAVGDPDGARIVFLHGSPGDANEWSSFLGDAPPGQYRIAVDRPGFGETSPDHHVPALGD